MRRTLDSLVAAALCLFPLAVRSQTAEPEVPAAEAAAASRPAPRLIDTSRTRPISEAVVPLTALESEAGQALLDKERAVDFSLLEPNWIPQYAAHCGAASAVIVANAMQPDLALTQDCLFTPETAGIITQDVVYRIGFTLDELTAMIATRTGLRATRFHAGTEEGEHGYDAWIAALKHNRSTPDNQLILNFAGNWLFDRENSGGHFSPVGDYNEAANQVLILEVNPGRQKYWVDAREMWDAMNKVDRVSGKVRGWIVVEQVAAAGEKTGD